MMDYAKSRIGVVSFLGIFINHGGGPESVGRGNALSLYRAQPAGIVECKKVDLNLNLQVVQTI